MRTPLALSLCFALACASPAPISPGSEDERAVLETVQAFFAVIESKDVAVGARVAIPEGVFVNVGLEDGARTLKHFTNAEWLARLPEDSRLMREEFEGEPIVLINGDIAVVWGRYTFEVDGKRNHTGQDVFNLIRTEEGWKISGGAYSVER